MTHKLIPSPGVSEILGYFFESLLPFAKREMYFQNRVQMMRVCEAKKTAREHLELHLSFAKLTGVHPKPTPSLSAAGLCSGTQPTLFVSTVSELWFEKNIQDNCSLAGFIGTGSGQDSPSSLDVTASATSLLISQRGT